MITKTAGFKACDGVVYATIEEARVAEMRNLLNETDGSAGVDDKCLDMLAADLIRSHSDNLLAILTTGRRRGGRHEGGRRRLVASGIASMREAVDATDASLIP